MSLLKLVAQKRLQRRQVHYKSPLKWLGFQKLGFLDDKPALFTPKLLSESPLGERAFEHFFHRIYRQQCFPHPVTGKLYRRKKRVMPQRIVIEKVLLSKHYPYEWQQTCTPVFSAKSIVIELPKALVYLAAVEKKVIKKKVVVPKIVKPVVKPPLAKRPIKKIAFQPTIIVEPPTKPVVLPPTKLKPIVKTKKRISKKAVIKLAAIVPLKTKPILPNNKPETIQPIPIASLSSAGRSGGVSGASGSSGGSFAPVPYVIVTDPKKTHGFTGNLYFKTGLESHNPSIGGTASWKPIKDSYWFIRTAIDYAYQAKDNPLSYSWGVGYDDWHQDTWSVQLNNWGPIKFDEGLAFDKAIANIGYKVKSDLLAKHKLSMATSLDIPITGKPALNATLQWTPKENWYVRANINQPIQGGKPTWSYGFGYSNWRPNKFNIEYSNYGSNKLFDTHFRKSGTLSISYNWVF